MSLHCNPLLDMSIAQGVGVFFLSLCLLTFDFCCQNPNKTNTAIINLCLNLLMFHLLNLLKPLFQPHLRPPVSVGTTCIHLQQDKINISIFPNHFPRLFPASMCNCEWYPVVFLHLCICVDVHRDCAALPILEECIPDQIKPGTGD